MGRRQEKRKKKGRKEVELGTGGTYICGYSIRHLLTYMFTGYEFHHPPFCMYVVLACLFACSLAVEYGGSFFSFPMLLFLSRPSPFVFQTGFFSYFEGSFWVSAWRCDLHFVLAFYLYCERSCDGVSCYFFPLSFSFSLGESVRSDRSRFIGIHCL